MSDYAETRLLALMLSIGSGMYAATLAHHPMLAVAWFWTLMVAWNLWIGPRASGYTQTAREGR